MKKLILFLVIATLFCSCKTIRYIPVETVKTEFRDKFIRDSIIRYDSIFVKEKGDTLILERYKYLYRDRIVRDSIFINDTIRVPYPVEVVKQIKTPLSGWQNFQLWFGRIAFVIFLFVGIYIIRKK